MPYPYNYYNDDSRSDKEKQNDWQGFALSVGAIAAFIVARKKIALSKGWEKTVFSAGYAEDPRFTRYISKFRRMESSRGLPHSKDLTIGAAQESMLHIMDTFGYLFSPTPSLEEQYAITYRLHERFGTKGVKFPSLEKIKSASQIKGGFWEGIFGGPSLSYYPPRTPTNFGRGLPRQVGQFGAVGAGKSLFFLSNEGELATVFTGFRPGIVASWGAAIERNRMGTSTYINPQNIKAYIKRVEINREALIKESRKVNAIDWVRRYDLLRGEKVDLGKLTLEEIISRGSAAAQRLEKPSYRSFIEEMTGLRGKDIT